MVRGNRYSSVPGLYDTNLVEYWCMQVDTQRSGWPEDGGVPNGLAAIT